MVPFGEEKTPPFGRLVAAFDVKRKTLWRDGDSKLNQTQSS